jgi:hypothetical protein
MGADQMGDFPSTGIQRAKINDLKKCRLKAGQRQGG